VLAEKYNWDREKEVGMKHIKGFSNLEVGGEYYYIYKILLNLSHKLPKEEGSLKSKTVQIFGGSPPRMTTWELRHSIEFSYFY